jgi:hypothetical protein
MHSGSTKKASYLHGIAGDVTSALLESLAEVGVRTQVQRGLALLVLDAQVRPVGSYSNNKSTLKLRILCATANVKYGTLLIYGICLTMETILAP